MGVGAIGAAIGEGRTAAEANLAISRNTKLAGDIFKSMLIGQAIAHDHGIIKIVTNNIVLKFQQVNFRKICPDMTSSTLSPQQGTP